MLVISCFPFIPGVSGTCYVQCLGDGGGGGGGGSTNYTYTVTGTVTDLYTTNGISNINVEFVSSSPAITKSSYTASNGYYSISFTTTYSSVTGYVKISNSGYYAAQSGNIGMSYGGTYGSNNLVTSTNIFILRSDGNYHLPALTLQYQGIKMVMDVRFDDSRDSIGRYDLSSPTFTANALVTTEYWDHVTYNMCPSGGDGPLYIGDIGAAFRYRDVNGNYPTIASTNVKADTGVIAPDNL